VRASALAAVTAALAAAGCGGASSTPPARTVALTAEELHGKTLFVHSCGSCHTLADAGTSGIAGPNLDDHPWREVTVQETIASGPGLMPEGLVQGGDASAVAAYVAAVTRR
jgi:mono/diheme cytochrome c family protein